MKIILNLVRRKCTQEMRKELKRLSLYNRRRFLRFVIIFEILNNLECPDQLKDIFKLRSTLLERQLRDKTLLDLPIVRTKIGHAVDV